MSQYVATIRAQYDAMDDAEAMLIADDIMTKGGVDLQLEDEDEIVVTQVVSTAPADTPEEVIDVLTRARDTLIIFRRVAYINLARELDRFIYAIENHDEDMVMSYDYGRFMDVMRSVLKPKEEE